jgi:hypothetical protein
VQSVSRKTTHRDKHASTLKPGATASKESHDEDDDTDGNADAIGTDHAVPGEKLCISRIRESKPDAHTQNTTAAKLKWENKKFNTKVLISHISHLILQRRKLMRIYRTANTSRLSDKCNQ